ncbi:BEN domain-containing protein 5 [Holothuria leucospilota]|uniref:BEN domain-containing protein 5 n=1 Tax=Holothuria leucospilota TaxID=206669 RepID=A0A9Q1CRT0_HOLLE|nr:BEN domain-containing protein 5 [Holothuria leucospilota]
MTENLLKKKRAPLFPATESECSQECVNKLHQARKRWREAEERNASLETESKRLRKDSEEYRQLNKDLQLELLKHLKLKTNTSVPNYSSSKANKPKPCSPFSSTSSRQSGTSYINFITGMGGKNWEEKQWEALRRHPKHSLFVKNLAVSVWGSEILKNRSVHGKACNRFKGKKETKQPLTPVKLDAVKDCFLNRLESLKVDAEMRQTEMSKFTRYIAEKIQDINRLSRKIGEE